jgi:enoyl-CoA hydratase/carnithine racemase
MSHVNISIDNHIGTIRMERGKVHALNEEHIEQLGSAFHQLESDDNARSIILTGTDKFFSFGLDVPELYDYKPDDCRRFLTKFTDLYSYLFIYPKPVIAAINGHAIAGGCMLAAACDRRIMMTGRGRIALNEVTFGSTVFHGAMEMFKYLCGRKAEIIAGLGAMYSAEEALNLGLIDEIADVDDLKIKTIDQAGKYLAVDPVAFKAIKELLRGPVFERMREGEADSIQRFIEIWYSPSTREKLKGIQIK